MPQLVAGRLSGEHAYSPRPHCAAKADFEAVQPALASASLLPAVNAAIGLTRVLFWIQARNIT